MKKLPTSIHQKNKKWILFDNDCGVTDVLRWGMIYEQNIFDYLKKSNIQINGVIDVGANLGNHAIHFADVAKKVHAFEPQRLIYYQLCGNIIINGYDNIHAYNLALGESEKDVQIESVNYYSDKTINIGDTHIDRFNASDIVKQKTLDSFAFTDISIIKIDVQGYEPLVIDGAKETIIKNRPTLFIEVELSQLHIYGYNEDSIFSRMNALGYKWEELPNGKKTDFVFTPKT